MYTLLQTCPYYSFNTWYGFFYDNISVIKHRLFLCSVEMFGAVIALQIWREKKWLIALSLPVMLSAIPLTGSRQSILTLAAMLTIWIICSLPVFTTGASTAALYTVTLKMADDKESEITKTFFRAFRDNFP